MMLPCTSTHAPGQHGVEVDGDAAWETDLAPMGVPAQHDIETCMGRLPIDFRGVRQKD